MPRVVRVRAGRFSDRVTVRMVVGQQPEDWSRRLDALGHGFGARSVQVCELPRRPGYLQLVVGRRDPLAQVVTLPAPTVADLGAIQLGRREDGTPWTVRLRGSHTLIAGATGAGKGSVLWSVIRGLGPAIRDGLVRLWVLDPKGGMELAAGRPLELYRWLLRRHVVPWIGGVPLGKVDTPLVREWRATLLAEGVSQSATAKAYRFLRAVLMTAVNEDRILPRNPCQVRGADREQPQERPVLSVAEVRAVALAMPERYRAMIVLTTFASLRFGEVTALQRSDIDVEAGTVRVRRALVEVQGGGLVAGPPKSVAGRRTVSIPPAVAGVMREHLAEFVTDDPTALVFTGPKGGAIRRGNFRKLTAWTKTVAELGLAGLHFHDLRVRHEAPCIRAG